MNFSSNFFWKLDLIRCFRELHVRKFRKFSPDHFYDENFQFYNKKIDFWPDMEITSETTILEFSSETTETRNPLSAWGLHPGVAAQRRLAPGTSPSVSSPAMPSESSPPPPPRASGSLATDAEQYPT